MFYQYKLADLIFQIELKGKTDIFSDESLSLYQSSENNPVIFTEVYNNWEITGTYYNDLELFGKDFFHLFYRLDNSFVCTLHEGKKGDVALISYTPEYHKFICIINEKDFYPEPRPVSWILRALPLNDIFQHYGRTLFHCSEILYKEKGIIFAGPSGAGKTTQANLWKKFRQAEVICNDRAVLRYVNKDVKQPVKVETGDREQDKETADTKNKGFWKVYGFPIDGSAPVRSNKVCRLGAVVLITQGTEDAVIPVSSAKKITLLMRQCVIEAWSAEANTKALEAMTRLIETVPVYYYSCTATERAVANLEKILINDGVFQ